MFQKQECIQNIIVHTMTSRHTNVTETNLHLAFCTHRTVEARMHSHVKKRACSPAKKIACTHMSACTRKNKRIFANRNKLPWVWRKHACKHAAALYHYFICCNSIGRHVPISLLV